MKKKSLALLLAIAIVVVGAVAGTVAWLTDKTPSVTNTFTTSDINIELKETKNNFQMIPGWNIEKDPKVTVKTGSEACYLFVKLEDDVTGVEMEDSMDMGSGSIDADGQMPEGGGAGGKYEEYNQVIDGETYYRDVYQEYYEQAMRILSEGGVVPEYIRIIIQNYFDAIQ